MSVWSFYATSYGNPGYVIDFFASKKRRSETDCDSLKLYDVYHKEDYDVLNNADDDECPITLKPLVTAHINDKAKVQRFST